MLPHLTAAILSPALISPPCSIAQAAVIRGRGSQFILKHHPAALHVLIVAPPETCAMRVMQSMAIDQESAEREIAHHDGSRRASFRFAGEIFAFGMLGKCRERASFTVSRHRL